MTWDKICSGASNGAHLIKEGLPARRMQAEESTQYIIVTDPPQGEKGRDSEQKAILDYWRENFVEVEYTNT